MSCNFTTFLIHNESHHGESESCFSQFTLRQFSFSLTMFVESYMLHVVLKWSYLHCFGLPTASARIPKKNYRKSHALRKIHLTKSFSTVCLVERNRRCTSFRWFTLATLNNVAMTIRFVFIQSCVITYVALFTWLRISEHCRYEIMSLFYLLQTLIPVLFLFCP